MFLRLLLMGHAGYRFGPVPCTLHLYVHNLPFLTIPHLATFLCLPSFLSPLSQLIHFLLPLPLSFPLVSLSFSLSTHHPRSLFPSSYFSPHLLRHRSLSLFSLLPCLFSPVLSSYFFGFLNPSTSKVALSLPLFPRSLRF